jgi:hypothetical protein
MSAELAKLERPDLPAPPAEIGVGLPAAPEHPSTAHFLDRVRNLGGYVTAGLATASLALGALPAAADWHHRSYPRSTADCNSQLHTPQPVRHAVRHGQHFVYLPELVVSQANPDSTIVLERVCLPPHRKTNPFTFPDCPPGEHVFKHYPTFCDPESPNQTEAQRAEVSIGSYV